MGVCKVPETGYVILCERALPGERLIGRIFKNHRAYSEVRPLVPTWRRHDETKGVTVTSHQEVTVLAV